MVSGGDDNSNGEVDCGKRQWWRMSGGSSGDNSEC